VAGRFLPQCSLAFGIKLIIDVPMTLLRRRLRNPWIYVLLVLVCFLFVTRNRRSHVPDTGVFRSVRQEGCELVVKGSSDGLLLKGTLLTPSGLVDDGYVLVQSDRIAGVGMGYKARSDMADVTIVDCTGSIVSPGFINLHEHIEFSIISPFEDFGERVKHRHDWRTGARNNTPRKALIEEDMIGNSIKWGEIRHVFSGTTSIVGGGMATGLARNLDFAVGLEAGLVSPPDIWEVFPLDDGEGMLRRGDCDYGPNAIDHERASKYYKFIAHVAEGIDEEAANEFRCLSDENYDNLPMPTGGGLSTDIIAPNLVLVHALGLSEADFDLVAERGAHIIWSPRSNMFLYGNTLNVSYLLEAGVNVAIGTDWLPSGSATMGREAICAASVTRQLFGRSLEPKAIWEMMTINAARAAGFEQHLGSLEAGKLADIVVFKGTSGDPHSQAIFSPADNIELVLRGGHTLLADDRLRDFVSPSCEEVQFDRSLKRACIADELGSSFADFAASLTGIYPAILPRIPPLEPSCHMP
jgi:cytosine/adenosine deaminase-related metal-dependent hydrolase